MTRSLLVVVLLTVLVAPLGHGGVETALDVGSPDTDGGAGSDGGLHAVGGGDTTAAMGGAQRLGTDGLQSFDRTVFSIEVYDNGSARWTFSYRRSLANDTQRQRFEAYAEEFNGEETTTYQDFKQRAGALTRAGENETDRAMNATGFRKDAYVNNLGNQGVVEMSFLWVGFGVTRGDRVVVGDVFEGGLYIGPDQRFVVGWSPSLRPVTATPAPTQNTSDELIWSGGESGTQFLDGQPRVVFDPANGSAGVTNGSGAGVDGGTPGDSLGDVPDDGIPLWPFAVGFAVVVGSIGVAARRGLLPPTDSDGDEKTRTDDATGRSGPSDGSSGGDAEPAIPDDEFMTDEDRVLAMLAENGGRMKQVNIVEGTDWSKSKVSMLLSDMAEAGQVKKLRVGRENIISRPGDEPAASRSETDDDA